MVKKILIWAHFWTFMVLGGASSASESGLLGRVSNCDYPAPEGFQIVSHSLSSFSFAWRPSFNGATYSLGVETSQDSLVWTPGNIISGISDTLFEIQNAPFEPFCKFFLSVDCEDGGANPKRSELSVKFIITIDVNGLIPVNYKKINCNNINVYNYNWLGFKVGRVNGSATESNFFQLQISDLPHSTEFNVSKVYNASVVTTANSSNQIPPPRLQVSNNFKIGKVLPNFIFEEIGRVKIDIVDYVHLDMCPSTEYSWSSEYFFEFYGEEKLGGNSHEKDPSELSRNSKSIGDNFIEEIHVSTPFVNDIKIFFPEKFPYFEDKNKLICLKLFDISGILVSETMVSMAQVGEPISIYCKKSGLYFLQIQIEGWKSLLKVVKI